jgi:hypothetical protein
MKGDRLIDQEVFFPLHGSEHIVAVPGREAHDQDGVEVRLVEQFFARAVNS